VASAFLLLLNEFRAEIEPVVADVATLLLSVAYGVGIVYFLTGMGMASRVPAESGARRLGWGIIGSLAFSLAAWIFFRAAIAENQEIERQIQAKIIAVQKANPKPPPGLKQELEQELARQWGPDDLKVMMVVFIGSFCLAKLLLTGLLWTMAHHFRQSVLASGLVIYLLAEVLGVVVAISIVFRQPGRLTADAPFALFTGTWYSVATASAFCAWFLVYVFQVRRAIAQAVLETGR
jgi:hypothetical protein